ncbi:uncharacterized protein LOC118201541 isoform X2 [Stegodyphus dumicola]|uniref:uncharacterized protein LOC118201541 isoform X2 n=1 Tax=Stegodyphus dumicola TaxID=202533 RepID=UPI0015B1D1CB|nr:uncharacterized protein LOC118201541 isoform X2 [Stegodyphus dumicola]
MLHTQLVKLAAPKTPSGATDDDSEIGHPKAEVLPPTLFSKSSTPESDDVLEEIQDPKFSTLNYQMKSSFTEPGNTESRFFWMIDHMSFRQLFRLYARYGDLNRDGESITLTCSDRWLRQAKVIDNKRVNTTDTGIYFRQVAKFKKSLNIQSYEKFLELLAKKKNLNLSEMKYKLVTCGPPSTYKTTMVDNRKALYHISERARMPRHHKGRNWITRTSEGFFSNCQCQHGYNSQVSYSLPDDLNTTVTENRDEDWFPED